VEGSIRLIPQLGPEAVFDFGTAKTASRADRLSDLIRSYWAYGSRSRESTGILKARREVTPGGVGRPKRSDAGALDRFEIVENGRRKIVLEPDC